MSSNQSIELYKSLTRFSKSQFDQVCFYLQKKYHYDLSLITLDKVPIAESARELIELLEQGTDGLNHLKEILENNKVINNQLPTDPKCRLLLKLLHEVQN